MMFHVKHILLAFIFLPVLSFSQGNFSLRDTPFVVKVPVDEALQTFLDRELSKSGCTKEEREFFYWVNYLRKNPGLFYSNCVVPFLKQFPEASGKEAKSLEKDLLASSKLSLFSFSVAATDAAIIHCADLALKQSNIGHVSSDGKNFSARMRLSGLTKCAAENIYTGKSDPLLSLMMLLLDIGLESAGHRKNLLTPWYNQMGVSIQTHRSMKRSVLVQIFSCS
ncbi:MAG: hypothetical protein RL634_880 [Bacteroidota bacterium]